MDLSELTPTEELEQDAKLRPLRVMATEAAQYLSSFAWCESVRRSWLGWGIAGICAVFLLEIEPASAEVDRLLWVIVGDMPSAYLVTDDSPTPLEALRNYLDLMEQWVENVNAGRSIKSCFPVDSPATEKNAEALLVRIKFLREKILI